MAKRKAKSLWRQVVILLMLVLMACAVAAAGVKKMQRAAYPLKYTEYVEYYAGKYDMDPMLVYAIIRTESSFKADAVSNVNAQGLMQITEVAFQWLKSRIAPTEQIVFEDLRDPELNVRFGSYYWACCLDRYGDDIRTAAASYFSGWTTVDNLLTEPEYSDDGITLKEFPYAGMRQYVDKIERNYSMYKKLYD